MESTQNAPDKATDGKDQALPHASELKTTQNAPSKTTDGPDQSLSQASDFEAYKIAKKAEDYLKSLLNRWVITAIVSVVVVVFGGFVWLADVVSEAAKQAAEEEAATHTDIIEKNISLLQESFLQAQRSFDDRRQEILKGNVQLQVSVEEFGSKLASLSSGLEDSNKRVESISEKIELMIREVGSLFDSLEDLKKSSSGIEGEMNSVEGRMQMITDRIESVEEDIGIFTGDLKSTRSQLEGYSAKLNELTKTTNIIYNLSKSDDEGFMEQLEEITKERGLAEGWPLIRRVAAERLIGILNRTRDDQVQIDAIELFVSLNGIESREAWKQDHILKEGIQLNDLSEIEKLSLDFKYPYFSQEQPIIATLPDALIRIVETGNEEPAERASFLLSRLYLTHQHCSVILEAIKRAGPFKNINFSGLIITNPSLREYSQKPLIEWAIRILNDETFLEMNTEDVEDRYLEMVGILQLTVTADDSEVVLPLYERGIKLLETEFNGDLLNLGFMIFVAHNGLFPEASNDILRLIQQTRGDRRRFMTRISGFTRDPSNALVETLFELSRSRDRRVSREAVMSLVRLSHNVPNEDRADKADLIE